MTSWIEDLALRRNSQNSNVFLVETLDFMRIDQLRKLLKEGKFEKMIPGVTYDSYLEHDIQTGITTDLRNGEKLSMDPEGPYGQLDKNLRRKKSSAVCIIKYPIIPGHGDALSNLIVPWSQDPVMYLTKSTVVIFTASLGLFNDNVRRLCYQISIPPSDADERRTILQSIVDSIGDLMKERYGQKTKPITFDERHINASSGLTLHDTESAALESFFLKRSLDVGVFTDYKVKILKNYGIEWVEPRRGFESVGGYQYLKDYILKRVVRVLTNPEEARRYGLDIPKGILLFGPPGTGKTYFSKAVAKESGLPMLKISPADFLRGIVGETEARVKQLTQLIETMTPCISFVDEFDQLSMRRDAQFAGDSGVSRRMQNMLLDWLGDENRKSFVIGATNFIDLDPAFIRPGRIDEIILVLPPDQEARQQILKVHIALRKTPVAPNLNLPDLARDTYMWSGAELERLVKEASALAMDANAKTVTTDHFGDAVKSFEVNADGRSVNIRAMIEKMKSLEAVNQRFLKEALKGFIQKDEATDSRLRAMVDGMPEPREA